MNKLGVLRHFLAAHWRFKQFQNTGLETYWQSKASKLLPWVRQHSPFYAQHWQEYPLADWQNLPTTNKTLLMSHFDQWNTCGVSQARARAAALEMESTGHSQLPNLSAGLSSGTSGQRGLFLVSGAEQSMWAGIMLARALPNLQTQRVAFFLRANNRLYQNIKNPFLAFRYFSLDTSIELQTQALNEYQPTLLIAPPSTLERLAQTKRTYTPKHIYAVAEVLESQDKLKLEEAFAVPVGQIYQATEGFLAVTCPMGHLHVQEDLIAVQLESLGRERFTPIITDWWRTTQPIIRYQLNDIWKVLPPCPCGLSWQAISVEGRTSDILELSGQKVFPSEISAFLHTCLIDDFLAIQDHPNQLRLHLHTQPHPDFEQKLRQYFLGVQLDIVFGIPTRPPLEKRRRVQNRHLNVGAA
jgi:putative adenylate-forming enzyme